MPGSLISTRAAKPQSLAILLDAAAAQIPDDEVRSAASHPLANSRGIVTLCIRNLVDTFSIAQAV